MDIADVMRSTPGIRDFGDDPVSPESILRALDLARFAPSGGNRQPWRVVVIVDDRTRHEVGRAYASAWHRLLDRRVAGGEWDASTPAITQATEFAESFATIAVHIAIWVCVDDVDVTDAGIQEPSIVSGASVYPFVQNLVLALRNEGLACRITTLLAGEPDTLRDILDVPAGYSLAALMAVGHPRRWPRNLARKDVRDFAWWNKFGGAAIES